MLSARVTAQMSTRLRSCLCVRGKHLQACLLAGIVLMPASGMAADAYPSRPVRLISPNPPGGANDLIARIVVTRLAEVLQVPIVIDNRGGAGGTIGGELAARAAPDGYTLLAGSISTHSFSPVIQPRLGYDPVRDFTPISPFAVAQNLLVVHPSVPASNVKELVALARAKPNTLNNASGGSGSTSHFAVALFVSVAGIAQSTVHVPYKGGAPATAATVGNETQFYLGPMAGSVAQVKAGKLRALAVGGNARSALMPEVPTVRESGVPAYQASGWFGLLGPAGLPRPIVMRLNAALSDAVSGAEVRRQLLEAGAEPSVSSPEAFAKFIADQLASTRKLVKDLDLRFD